MKLKYYLRGLGIGIVVTALIFMITSGKEEGLSDAEIRERAAQLGMVDASSMTLSTLVTAGQQTEETTDKQEQGTKPEETKETEADTKSQESDATSSEGENQSTETEPATTPSETENQPAETAPEMQPSEVETKPVPTITIGRGADSYSVCKDLEAAGLIPDAREYDAYLCENGYSKRISIGTYEIPIGTSQEEIAKIITGKR